ncbi:MAG: hypothetical protein AAF604_02835 [Acidobacteriota bacterium]
MIAGFALAAAGLFYTSSLAGVDDATVGVYRALKAELEERGHQPRLWVLSGRRFALDNALLTQWSGASRNSLHLRGDAIDLLVLDVDGDGRSDGRDVDIVYRILDRSLIRDAGGVGTYKGEADFFSRQMVHFDLRGHRARWHR